MKKMKVICVCVTGRYNILNYHFGVINQFSLIYLNCSFENKSTLFYYFIQQPREINFDKLRAQFSWKELSFKNQRSIFSFSEYRLERILNVCLSYCQFLSLYSEKKTKQRKTKRDYFIKDQRRHTIIFHNNTMKLQFENFKH